MAGLSGAARLEESKAAAIRVPGGLKCPRLPYTIMALTCAMRRQQFLDGGRTRPHLCAGEECEHFKADIQAQAIAPQEKPMKSKTHQEDLEPRCRCGRPKGSGSKRCLQCQGRYANSLRHKGREERAPKAGAQAVTGDVARGPVSAARAQAAIQQVCKDLAEMLVAKNRAYGNSALDPVRVFSKAGAEEQIRVRLDDKLSRLVRGEAAGEDAEWDLMGYLVLLRVAKGMAAK